MCAAVAAVVLGAPRTVLAAVQSPPAGPTTTVALDTVWTTVMALCVYLMHGGFGFFEAGMTRRRSTVTTLTHNLVVLVVTAMVYWAFGFAFMFGDGPAFIGLHGFAPSLLPETAGAFAPLASRPVPLAVAFAFSLAYADTPATLVAGSGAERLKLSGFMLLTLLISGVLFPLAGRAVWGNGILARLPVPFYDSGAATLQLVGGLCALVTCWKLGPREGRFDPDGTPNRMAASSMPLVFLGVFILWAGFLAFNVGFAMHVTTAVALILANSVLGGMAGGFVSLFTVWLLRGKGSLRAALIGMLAATVAVTSMVAIAEPWAMVVTGAVVGALTPVSIHLVTRLGLDDPTEYLTMNVVGGAIGTLAVGVFADPTVARRFGATPVPHPGILHGGVDQMLGQVVGFAAIVVLIVPAMVLAVYLLQRAGLLRVSARDERAGSDIASHGERAYSGFAWAPEDESAPVMPAPVAPE